VQLREEHLLKGILYGLYEFDHHPNFWHQRQDRDTLLYLLDVLGNGFRFESPEKMILDIAVNVKMKTAIGRVVPFLRSAKNSFLDPLKLRAI
jgi:hypothetical protein